MATFTLEYWIDDDWYVGRLREVPGIFSQGKTLEELNLKDAYHLMTEDQETPTDTPVQTEEIRVQEFEKARVRQGTQQGGLPTPSVRKSARHLYQPSKR
jgi:predicted RNase H-like HicB family nuclease